MVRTAYSGNLIGLSCASAIALCVGLVFGDETAANDEVTSICRERLYYKQIYDELDSWLRAAVNQKEQLAKELKELTLAELKAHDSPKAPGYAVLLALTGKRLNEQRKVIQAAKPKLDAALSLLQAKEAQLRALQAISAITAPASLRDGTHGSSAVTLSGQTTKSCDSTATFTLVTEIDCTPDTEGATKIKEIRQHFQKAKNIATGFANINKLIELTVGAETKGNVGGATLVSTGSGPYCPDDRNNDKATASAVLAAAPPKIKSTYTMATATLTGTSGAGSCPKFTETGKELLITDEQLGKALCEAQKAKPATYDSLSTETAKGLSEKPEVQALAQLILSPLNKLSDDTEQRKALAAKLFGGEQTNLKEKIFNSLSSETITYTAGAEKKEGKITDLASGDDFASAVAYFVGKATVTMQQISKKLRENGKEKETGDATGDKKDEVCTGTEEGKCDKTKCDWNAEKKECKVKEGAAVISAVIKAPLLLAFLLLAYNTFKNYL
uniref:Variant surface glycoprotein 1125.1662 n=1 Tax=Trypanosoma brucei TaxID=5691 RepID=A0A1J0R7S0_9TRYP|nr:variant surface glycoprotein 1125.1662 [Trypanosoma brucei]